jgi:pimeloyl-ACP methyl ester carboxylesterase
MNLQCVGKGAPTVIFSQGWGGTILDWAKVQPTVSGFTRACFYDRAGEGYSDPANRPATPQNVTDDLHALLHAARISGPVVLVGHSLGGLYVTLYADRFLDEVSGLVLVDSSFSGQDDVPETDAEKAALDAALKGQAHAVAACTAHARAGELSLADPHHCFEAKPPFSAAEIAYLLPAYLKPFRWEAMASEQGHLDEERPFARPWGDRPVIALTRDHFPAAPGQSEASCQANADHWKEGHDQLAARSSRGSSIVVANSNHYIQNDQPQAVAEAIRKVVMQVREGRKP